MLNDTYISLWAGLLNALVHMFEEGVDTSTPQVDRVATMWFCGYKSTMYCIGLIQLLRTSSSFYVSFIFISFIINSNL